MQKKIIHKLIKDLGRPYSEELGIDLDSGRDEEIFKWFLASILFGARISETCAKNTYKAFERRRILTPNHIKNTGWHEMISIMGEGGYARYDGKTTHKLWDISKRLLKKYKGRLNNLHKFSKDYKNLEEKLQDFKGVGPVTTNIFLRELRAVWKKADPEVSPLAKLAAKNLSIDLSEINRRTKNFIKLECALLRLGKNYCRKGKCGICEFRECCKRFSGRV